jgi:hypothetical protein
MERIPMKKNSLRTIPAVLALAFFLAVSAVPASAAINYYFNNFSPNVPSITYDWTSSQQLIVDTGSAGASGTGMYGFIFWDFKPAVGARFFSNGTDTIAYTIKKYLSSTVTSELYTYSAGVTTDNVFSTTLYGANTNMSLPFVLIPTAGLIKPAGTYTTSITVGYYKGTKSGTAISNAVNTGASYSQQVNLIVPVIFDLSIMPSGNTTFNAGITSQTLDFSTMTDGETMSANAIIRTNSNSWSLAASSTNAGKMKNGVTNTTVPYTFIYNGTVKPLSSTSTAIDSGGWAQTSSGYATRPMTFTLVDTFNTPGTYTDNLIFTLTAN